MRMDDKRGLGLDDIYPAVLTIVLIGIILGIGLYVLAEVESNTYNKGTVVTVLKEATLINHTTDHNVLDTISARSWGNPTLTGLWNDTKTYAVANATVSSAGVITNTSSYSFDDDSVKVNYTYTWSADSAASGAINESVSGIGGFAEWIAVIVVVMAAAIVLGIVLKSFGRRTPGV